MKTEDFKREDRRAGAGAGKDTPGKRAAKARGGAVGRGDTGNPSGRASGAIKGFLNGVPADGGKALATQAAESGKLRREAVMNRVISAAAGMTDFSRLLANANQWREKYNPLRGLSISRAVTLLEEGERGAYADLQWLYRYIEMQDATLGALIQRRLSAVEEMDWGITLSDAAESPEEKAMAAKQQAALKDLYAGIRNMQQAIEELCIASFRGYCHLEKVYSGDGDLIELAPIPQWHWCRDGLSGEWQLNIDSRAGATTGTPVDLSRLIVREVSRPINRVALVAYVRKNLSQKDWDGFVETFGIPAIFLVLPPELGEEERETFQEVAEQIVSDARGVLPGNSDVKTIDNGARGANPFRDHIKYQDEQMVLLGTGGKLTMLAESGSGTLAGGAHSETFQSIARAEARKISELMRDAIDRPFLEEHFPGQPVLAKFEIAANEETDTGEVIKGAAALNGAGYKVKAGWLQEKTGYELETQDGKTQDARPEGERPEAGDAKPEVIRNREEEPEPNLLSAAAGWIEAARLEDHAGLVDGLRAALAMDDDEAMQTALQEWYEELPEEVGNTPAMEAAWEKVLAVAMGDGLETQDDKTQDTREEIRNADPEGGVFRYIKGRIVHISAGPPARLTVERADKMLEKGFEVKDATGNVVRFGKELKEKLDRQPDGAARKELLRWARETVRGGDKKEVAVNGEKRTYYGKVFTDETTSLAVLVIVDAEDGYAFNYHRLRPSQLERKLSNRSGDETGEQPPVVVLKAFLPLLAPNRID